MSAFNLRAIAPQIRNASLHRDVKITQITTLSPRWQCHLLPGVELSRDIPPIARQQSASILLGAVSAQEPEDTGAFSVRQIDRLLQGQDITSDSPGDVSLHLSNLVGVSSVSLLCSTSADTLPVRSTPDPLTLRLMGHFSAPSCIPTTTCDTPSLLRNCQLLPQISIVISFQPSARARLTSLSSGRFHRPVGEDTITSRIYRLELDQIGYKMSWRKRNSKREDCTPRVKGNDQPCCWVFVAPSLGSIKTRLTCQLRRPRISHTTSSKGESGVSRSP